MVDVGGTILKHLVVQLLVTGDPWQVSDQNPPLSYLKHAYHIDYLLNADQFSRYFISMDGWPA